MGRTSHGAKVRIGRLRLILMAHRRDILAGLALAAAWSGIAGMASRWSPAVTVRGRVVYWDGTPVPHALVLLAPPGPKALRARATDSTEADSTGRFVLRTRGEPGCYAVGAAYLGAGWTERTFPVPPNRVDVGLVTLKKSAIPEPITTLLMECRVAEAVESFEFGVDTVVVKGTLLTPLQQ